MKKLRDILILLLVAAAFAFSLNMFRKLVGLESPWFAFIAMLDVLGLIAFARPLFLLRMPRSLRAVRAWEAEGALYRGLRVPAFGTLLRRTPLRYLNPLVYLSRTASDPAMVRAQMEGAEAAHFWTGALIVPYMVYAGIQNWWSVVGWFSLVQVVGNLYPIMHLRLARGRLERLLGRLGARREHGAIHRPGNASRVT